MARHRKPTGQDLMRLDAIAKHLRVKSRYPDATFTADVVAACVHRMEPVVSKMLPCTGEEIADGLGEHLNLTFEEVRTAHDVTAIEARYLKGKKEIGFAQLRGELQQPGVDALLFQRMHATESDPDRWVAVLNLQESEARAYWNRFHEMSHRIAEPPQGILPFRRHQFEATNPVEAVIDAVAAKLAFYEPALQPLIHRYARAGKLDFNVVEAVRQAYAPSASLLSTINAVVACWPTPAAAITAELRGRKNAPATDIALRVTPQAYSKRASKAGLTFIPNMRVPVTSPMFSAFHSGVDETATERLSEWATSEGARLASLNVVTSARRMGSRVYAIVSA